MVWAMLPMTSVVILVVLRAVNNRAKVIDWRDANPCFKAFDFLLENLHLSVLYCNTCFREFVQCVRVSLFHQLIFLWPVCIRFEWRRLKQSPSSGRLPCLDEQSIFLSTFFFIHTSSKANYFANIMAWHSRAINVEFIITLKFTQWWHSREKCCAQYWP